MHIDARELSPQLTFCCIISFLTRSFLNSNNAKGLSRCETTKGCGKHYIEKTINGGETMYVIERSCKSDDVCYSDYVNCHDIHVCFNQPIRKQGYIFYPRKARKLLDVSVKAVALKIFAMMREKNI